MDNHANEGCEATKLSEFFKPDGSNWIRGYDAADMYCRAVPIFDKFACKWCLVGAIHYIYGSASPPEGSWNAWYGVYDKLLAALDAKHPLEDGEKHGSLIIWHDKPERTVEEVIELCRLAGV